MKKPGVKERIIDTASRLFYYDGYNQTGINKIIEEAGVAKASMYQHFRSKEDIAVAYLERKHQAGFVKMAEYVADKSNYKEKTLAAFDYLYDWLSSVNFRGCVFQNIITDLPKDHIKIRDKVRNQKNERRNWVQNLIKSGGAYSDVEAEKLGDEIMILMEGAIIMTQIQQDGWPIKTAKETCRKLLD